VFQDLVLAAAQIIEGAGVVVILGGATLSALYFTARALHARDWSGCYRQIRQAVGRSILLGLELLVGADIIRTVSELPTLQDVLVLALIVLIRTFLSFTLEVEIDGRWPWQRRTEP
jgi:uncharacterized membrane protein